MGCRRTRSFLDLPLILGCGDQLCQILAASTRPLPPQKFDFISRTCHHLLCQILFLGESVLEDQIVFPSKQTFVVVSVLFLCVRQEMRQKFIQFLLRNSLLRFCIFYPLIFFFNLVQVCQECNNSFPSCFSHISRISRLSYVLFTCCCIRRAGNNCAIVSRLNTFVIKNQPITVLVLLCESQLSYM